MPKKLTFWWPAAVGILGVVLVLAGYIAIGQLFSPKSRAMRALSLGEKYLTEGKYEQSILQFNDAIEIAQSEPSILYLADQTQNRLDVAIRTGAAAQVKAQGGDIQDAVVWLESVQCMDQPAAQTFIDALSLLEQLRDFCAAENYDAVFSLLANERYKQIIAEIMGLDCEMRLLEDSNMTAVYRMDVATENFATGNNVEISGLATPESASDTTQNGESSRTVSTDYMVYYGGAQDGIRNGEGIWLAYQNSNNYLARGTWVNGVPNGRFETRSWQADLEESVTYRIITGNIKNGLWDGPVSWSFERGDQTDTYDPSFSDGHWEILREEDGYAVVAENSPEDRLVATTDDLDKTHGLAGYAQSA